MNKEQRERLREAAGKATHKTWAAFTDDRDLNTNIVSFTPRTECVFALPGRDKREPDIEFLALANPATVLALLDALDAAENENETLRLTLMGGEDAPGYAASLSLDAVIDGHDRYQGALLASFDEAESRATAAEARVVELEGLLADYNTRILLAHDALEAARDKMRGAVEEDDQSVYDRVHTAIYVLRSRQARALAAKLGGRGDG